MNNYTIFLILLAFFFFFQPRELFSQASRSTANSNSYDLVILNNGSEIKGDIVSRNRRQVRIATITGGVFLFNTSEIKSITKVNGKIEIVDFFRRESVILKDGTVIKGKVVSDEGDYVEIDTPASNTFFLEKNMVEKVVKASIDYIFRDDNVKYFSRAERLSFYEELERHLWVTATLTTVLPAGGYYYLWSTGKPYFDFVKGGIWEDVVISLSVLSVNGFATYLTLDRYFNFGFFNSNPQLVDILTITFTSLLVVLKGIEYLHTSARTTSFNQNIKSLLLLEDEVSFRFDLTPSFSYKNDELAISFEPFKFYF